MRPTPGDVRASASPLVRLSAPAAAIAAAAAYGHQFRTHFDERGEFLIHLPNLLIHELGHPLFGLAGHDELTALGGSLMQGIVPLVAALVAFWRRQPLIGALMLCWLAMNCRDVAVYVDDAQDRLLPLTTGDEDSHDWWYLLQVWDRMAQRTLYVRRLEAWGMTLYVASIAPAAAQDPGFRPPALAPQGPPPIPKGALGWTFCRAGVAESWIRAD
ncbi:MAG: hypothetical protein NW201_11850, partial [Gemmatimonadales bacterium]|nr:hypothetical protein [Gemmatimonadales bacterium]